jgi:hypothetical protein
MKFDKEKYRNLTFNGFVWWGFVEGLHNFRKELERGKWLNVQCTEEQLYNGDIQYMTEKLITK